MSLSYILLQRHKMVHKYSVITGLDPEQATTRLRLPITWTYQEGSQLVVWPTYIAETKSTLYHDVCGFLFTPYTLIQLIEARVLHPASLPLLPRSIT